MSGTSDAVNPALTLVAGERVRLILRNRDPGMLHDLTIERFAERTPAIPRGESASVVFTVPQGPASASYVCSFHTQLMRGDVRVRSR